MKRFLKSGALCTYTLMLMNNIKAFAVMPRESIGLDPFDIIKGFLVQIFPFALLVFIVFEVLTYKYSEKDEKGKRKTIAIHTVMFIVTVIVLMLLLAKAAATISF